VRRSAPPERIIDDVVGDHSRTRSTVLALIVAVACTGLIGYLVSRPAPVHGAPHTSKQTAAPVVQGPTPIPTPAPIARGYTVADDPATGQVVVYGGNSGTGGDTWIWKGTWVLASPATQPPALFAATAAYDPDLHMLMLAGGQPFDSPDNNGTWEWDGTTWRILDADISQPPVGGGTMAWDQALQQMVLVTGVSASNSTSSQTWIWSGNAWVPKGGSASFQASGLVLGFDDSLNALIAVSCCVANQETNNTGVTQTWRWDGSAWHLFGTTLIPSLPAFVGVGWDSITHSMLMSGQLASASSTGQLRSAPTWRLVGHNWVAINAVPDPVVASASLIETDDGLRLVLANTSPKIGISPFQIWAWTGKGWKQLD
jgi:hypothetical protein